MRSWTKEHPYAAIFISLALLLGTPMALIMNEVYQTQRKAIDYQVSNKIEVCESANNSRTALLSVLDQAGEDTGAGAVELTALPAYAMVDEDTKLYLRQLDTALKNQPDGAARLRRIARDLRKTNPPNVDCQKVGAALRKELE